MANGQWFKHDSNASRDPRMLRLKKSMGREALSIFWEVVEKMRENEDDYGILLEDLDVLIEDVPNLPVYVDAMVTIGLLYSDGGKVYSARLLRDMEVKNQRSAARSDAGRAGAAARWDSNRMANDAVAMAKNAKSKKRRVEKKVFAPHVLLTEEESQKLVDQYGMAVFQKVIQKLDSYKQANGKEYKSDYGAIRQWVLDAVKAVPLQGVSQERCPKCDSELSGGRACLKCGWRKK